MGIHAPGIPAQYLEGFLEPFDTEAKPKLMMVEPYQPGKIPVVFIHGLLSDPMTWVDTANELRAVSDLYRRFQFWGFRYPTGGALLESAADLREKLLLAREVCDPHHQDPALERMVLVGHSMGGLMSRLQVTYSLDILWRQAARQPLEAIRAEPNVRERLRRQFFFDPSPLVTRSCLHRNATPGVNLESGHIIGRLGSNLVRLWPTPSRSTADSSTTTATSSIPSFADLPRPVSTYWNRPARCWRQWRRCHSTGAYGCTRSLARARLLYSARPATVSSPCRARARGRPE